MAESSDDPNVSNEDSERGEQSVAVEEIGPARKRLTIEIPADRIANALEKNLSQLKDDAQIPGFRKGRAPMKLVERRFSTAVREDVRGQLISESYTQAIEEHELDVIGQPDVKDAEEIQLPESGPLKFEVEVETTPDLELPSLDGIAVNKVKFEVADDDVDGEIDRLRKQYGQMELVKEGKIKAGDFVLCDVRIRAGKDAGEDAEEIAHHPGTYVLVPPKKKDESSGQVAGILVENLAKQLIGKTAGSDLAISMTGPQSHEDERIRNNPITLALHLESVSRTEPVDLETVQTMCGVESHDELKDQLQQNLTKRGELQQTSDMYRQIGDALLDQVKMDLPEGLTERQTQRVMSRRKLELAYQGVPEQEIEQRVAEQRGASEEEVQKQLKHFFILSKAAKQLDVEVSEAKTFSSARAKYSVGRARVTSRITRSTADMCYGALQLGEHNVNVGVRRFGDKDTIEALYEDAASAVKAADFPELIRHLDKRFGSATYSLKTLSRDSQWDVTNRILQSTLHEVEIEYERLYERRVPLMRFFGELGMTLPRPLRLAAETVLNARLRRELEQEELDTECMRDLLEEARSENVSLDGPGLSYAFQGLLEKKALGLRNAPSDIGRIAALNEAVSLGQTFPFEVNLWRVQNLYFELLEEAYPRAVKQTEHGDLAGRTWLLAFEALGEKLDVRVPQRDMASE